MSMNCADYNILDQHVLVQYGSTDLRHQLAHPLRPFAFSPTHANEPDLILTITPAIESGCYDVACEGRIVGQSSSIAHCFRLVEWQLDMFLSAVVSDRLLLHAGAVAKHNMGVIFPAVSGSGKSSLTLALLLEGYEYLSDELAVLDSKTGCISAFPKPLSIKNRDLFPDLITKNWFGPSNQEIEAARLRLPDYQPVWYIHADELGATICRKAVPVRYIVFPRYAADLSPRLIPLDTNDTLQLLLENSVNFPQFAGKGLNLLTQLAVNATGYRLDSNNLEASVQLVQGLMSAVS